MGLNLPNFELKMRKKVVILVEMELKLMLVSTYYSLKGGEIMEVNFNRHLGSRLRMRRLALGLTQTKVAQAINVTFQQIQKYEKGTNGISSLRIMQLANFLKVPVVYFFEEFPGFSGNEDKNYTEDDFNYSFLAKLFTSLSEVKREKILQVLKNTRVIEKTG